VLLQPVDAANEGRLAGSRRAQHREELAPGNGKIEVFYTEVFTVIALLDAVEHDEAVIRVG